MIQINLLPKKTCTECLGTKPSYCFQRKSRENGRFGIETLSLGSLSARCLPCLNDVKRDKISFASGKPRRKFNIQPEDGAYRVCARCSVPKLLEEFYSSRTTYCRVCVSDRHKETLAKIPEINKRYAVKRYYGITLEDKEAMLAAQGGKCLICGGTESRGKGWAVDHDHSCCPGTKTCGKCIRGILCSTCNNGLGCARDNVEILRRMILYLEQRMVKKAAA
jgi:hypothetical protein